MRTISLVPSPYFSCARALRGGGGKSRAWYTLSAHVPKYPGILGHRDTIRTFSDIFVIINGHDMYSASVRVTVKLAFLVPLFLSCLSRMSFLDFEGGTAVCYHDNLRRQSRSVCLRAMVKARLCCFLWTLTLDRGEAVLFSCFSTHGRPGPTIGRARLTFHTPLMSSP